MDTNNNNYTPTNINAKLTEDTKVEPAYKGNNQTPEVIKNYAVLRQMAIFKFGSISGFAKALGVGDCLGSRLLSGSYVPRTAKTIRKIAEALALNQIVLTQFFTEQLHSKLGEEKT